MTCCLKFKNGIRQMKKFAVVGALAVIMASGAVMPTMADPYDHRDNHHDDHRGGHDDHHGGPPHGHPAQHFRGFRDADWHGGRWIHGNHGGRVGWWWMVSGQWFFYPEPVYPYPVNPYAPAVVAAPPVVMEAPPPPSPGINLIIPLNIR